MSARVAMLATGLVLGGCADLVGISDATPLTCDELYVIRDDGRRLEVFPAFTSDVTSYHVVVSSITFAVQLGIHCDDPDLLITAGDVPIDRAGVSVPIALPQEITNIHVVVTTDTDAPPAQRDYTIAVQR